MADTKPKKPETKSEAKEEVTADSEAADSTVVDSSETSEFVDKLPGEAGEKASEQKSDSAGGGVQGDDDDDATKISSDLKEIKLPSRRVMKQQVRSALIKEETKLIRDANKYARRGDFFNLNEALAKVREIRFMLSELVKATLDSLKSLWMKYVYNK